MKRRTLHIAGSYAQLAGLIGAIAIASIAIGCVIEGLCSCIASEWES
jgi:hypothetical protein